MFSPLFRSAVLAILLAAVPVASKADHPTVRLHVDLTEIHGPALIPFLRAAVPEVWGNDSRVAYDLPTLAILHAHVAGQIPWLKEHGEQVEVREMQTVIEKLMREALKKTSLAELQRLAIGDGKQRYGNAYLEPAWQRLWIAAEVAKIRAERGPKPVFPEKVADLPGDYQALPGADGAAFRRASGPYASLLENLARQKPRGLSEDSGAYGRLVSAFLFKGEKKVANDLMRFQWDSFCGTGASEFNENRLTLAFMGLLRERRVAEALGLSFFLPAAPEWMREPGRPFDQWRIDLLKYCGFDWEEVLVPGWHVEFLAAAGSEKAAKYGLSLPRGPDPDFISYYWDLDKMAAFLIPGDPQYWDNEDPRKTISAETQRAILALLVGPLRDDVNFQELDKNLKIIEQLRRKETAEALRRVARFPSTTYANRAVWALRQLGEEIAEVPPAPPVRFRIYLNDEPWRRASIGCCTLNEAAEPGGGDSVRTDADGFATIPRDFFLDPGSRGTHLRFSAGPYSGDTGPLQTPWVGTKVPAPKAFDETTIVKLTACAVPVEIDYGGEPPSVSRGPTELKLTRVGASQNEGYFSLRFAGEHTPPPRQFTLTTIAPGNYQFSVNAPGISNYLSEPFEVKPAMEPVQIKLSRGYEVFASLSMPENARGWQIELWCDGKDVTKEYSSWTRGRSDPRPLFVAMPRGTYQVRIISTAEYVRRNNLKEWPEPQGKWQADPRLGVDCEGVTVDFTIDEKTPSLLDLGPIENKPVEAMRAKAKPAILFYQGLNK